MKLKSILVKAEVPPYGLNMNYTFPKDKTSSVFAHSIVSPYSETNF